jgi:hypothetical protein
LRPDEKLPALHELGEMGIGVELYFYLLMQLAKHLSFVAALQLPALVLHAHGDALRGG